MGDKKKWEADPTQIDCIQNKENLIAACSSMVLANMSEKSFAGIHGRYSRIRLNVTDYKSSPSVFTTFYLKPTEIRRLYRRVYLARESTQHKMYEFRKHDKSVVDREKHRVKAEALTIVRCPWQMDFSKNVPKLGADGKPVAMRLQWTITIQMGSCLMDGKDFKVEKTASKKLTDEQFEDFLTNVVRHIELWELAFGVNQVREMEHLQQERRQKYHSDELDVGDAVEDDIGDTLIAAPPQPARASASVGAPRARL